MILGALTNTYLGLHNSKDGDEKRPISFKLDRVDPINNRPSLNLVHHFKKNLTQDT